MSIAPSRVFISLALAGVLVLSGCAATQIVNQWSNPEYPSHSFKKTMVIGISKQTSIRRTFEDEFVAQLRSAGVDAVPSYRYIKEDAQVPEPRLKEAVIQAGADGAVITRLVRVERKTDVTPGYYDVPPPFGFYGWYSHAWNGYYEPPRVYQYEVYISETSLYDMIKNEVVWTGSLETRAPGNIRDEIKKYAETVIQALRENHLLGPGSS